MTEDLRHLIVEALERNRKLAEQPNALTKPQVNPITGKPMTKKESKDEHGKTI